MAIPQIPLEKIRDFSKRWKITELAFFGSVLRGELRPESDLDVLVTFQENAPWTLLDHMQMEEELSEIFRRKVDLISRRGIEHSRNLLRKQAILESAQTFYAAA